jgi:hypothetical protein
MKQLKATHDGFVEYMDLRKIEKDGIIITLNKTGYIAIYNKKDTESLGYRSELARFSLPTGAEILIKRNERVSKGETLATWDSSKIHILSEKNGTARYIFSNKGDKTSLYIDIVNETGTTTGRYLVPPNDEYIINDGKRVEPGTLLATSISKRELLKRKVLEEVKNSPAINI